MSDEPPKPNSKAAREARLAEALRANLRRRKAQQRARGHGEPAQPQASKPAAKPK